MKRNEYVLLDKIYSGMILEYNGKQRVVLKFKFEFDFSDSLIYPIPKKESFLYHPEWFHIKVVFKDNPLRWYDININSNVSIINEI